jgi:acyl phosphate:glycerol-3-phosphate acyltransferase
VNGGRVLWVAGAYLAGTLPSTLVVARANRARTLIESARRHSGEADPHILMTRYLGVGWTAVAATLDVLKGLLFLLSARHWGDLDSAWLAVAGTAVVVGHSFPFYARQMAGRGLAAAAGVYLVLLPVEMTVAGLLIVLGGALRATGLLSTIGMALVPMVAAVQRQPASFVAMGVAILAILLIRRVEGVGEVIRSGISPGKAVWYRIVFDSSGPPSRPRQRRRETSP